MIVALVAFKTNEEFNQWKESEVKTRPDNRTWAVAVSYDGTDSNLKLISRTLERMRGEIETQAEEHSEGPNE